MDNIRDDENHSDNDGFRRGLPSIVEGFPQFSQRDDGAGGS
ncbi:hypothetical protein C4K22_4310 [Pseudomonas chlororaphis subsp. aurantiaca]|uniref:Uncharacterized protein n=1 Tax=Pseudomonas chlororaphis subsp. aureofaciens TaxID=587851 RepID=A0AAD0ZKV7_9PSED|nr:hypothetical protein C4K22_4310 [Pseudomonas chlororaphis subsp. aurantiaca]AZE24723.1 hypothetical protein C4K08_4304 [Pseudomonas chlororaphis subsp. aureofaciens]AZD43384.1 hypothetical protein C4K21_4318 [Pseudomonas chlororaphis subsp. aurantiaca]AZD49623.1 hypothetical protein C4K20_4216 [Pseudomonas chlororaphis subsp. aurantiaca]AZD74519.1 hypothetical protein C4K16_4167 [Pseudomonas chlororaphis subsp. aurantiaca]